MNNTGKVLVLFVLLSAVIVSEDCTSDEYDTYLEHYRMKCGNDCAEYKRWV